MKFCFEEYNVILKTGLVRLLAEWTNSETTSSILYDSRFVQLLVVALFSDDEIINNNFDKKKMNFMKGNFFLNTMKYINSSFISTNLTYISMIINLFYFFVRV